MGSTNVEETTARTDTTNGTNLEGALAGNVATNATNLGGAPSRNATTNGTSLEGSPVGNVVSNDTHVEGAPAGNVATNNTKSEEVLAGNVATNDTKSEETPAENVATDATDLEEEPTEKVATDDTNSEKAPAANVQMNGSNSEKAAAKSDLVNDTDSEEPITPHVQETYRRNNSWLPPPWALAAIAILGFNEFMILLRNPLYLMVLFVIYLVSKAIWVLLDITREFHHGTSTNVEETTARTDMTNGTNLEGALAGNVATNATNLGGAPSRNATTNGTSLEGSPVGNVVSNWLFVLLYLLMKHGGAIANLLRSKKNVVSNDTNSEEAPAANVQMNGSNSEKAASESDLVNDTDSVEPITPHVQNECIMLESWGGGGGQKWETEKISASTQIKRIIINSGDAIDSIEFIYKIDGEEKSSGVKGGRLGTPQEFFLNEGEEIETIEGSYAQGWVNGPVMITWLKFIVGRTGRESPSFGSRRGKDFKITAANGKIVGFHGRAGSYVDAIGVYIEPKYRNTLHAEIHKRKSIRLSQWGGGDGVAWGDEPIDPSTRVTKIIIRHGDFIDSFKYEYKVEGSETETEGGDGEGGEETAIVLHPCEYITGIRGSYGDLWDDPNHDQKPPKVIHRLTFYTNQSRRFGPFGLKRGKHFSFSAQDGKIVGFHGVSGKYLEGLGVFLAAAN